MNDLARSGLAHSDTDSHRDGPRSGRLRQQWELRDRKRDKGWLERSSWSWALKEEQAVPVAPKSPDLECTV